jgi:hypothetical protein
MGDLRQRFSRARRDYAKLKRTCEAQVVEWRWATWTTLEDGPYYFERHRWGRGRWLKGEPATRAGRYQYGFDAAGRVVVEREVLKVGKWPESWKEEFLAYGSDTVDTTLYDHDTEKSPINVTHTTLRDGHVVTIDSWARGGQSATKFRWVDDLPVEMTAIHKEHGRKAWRDRFRFTHDDVGRLARIDRASGKIWSVVYQRPSKKESPAALASIIATRLCELIPKAVARARVKQPAYCLLLAYDWENPGHCLPPNLAIGLDEERQRFIAEHGKSARHYLWNPAELGAAREPFLDDKGLAKACDLFTQQLALADRFAPILKMLVDVCRALNRRDWSKLLPTTSDFVVLPVDLEGAHVARHLKALRNR